MPQSTKLQSRMQRYMYGLEDLNKLTSQHLLFIVLGQEKLYTALF